MLAPPPSRIMESTTVGRAPKAPAPLLWMRPRDASIFVDGVGADRAIQATPTPIEGLVFQYPDPGVYIGVVVGY